MNDIRFSGITRVELHALSQTDRDKVLKSFAPGQTLKVLGTDVFVGHVPKDMLSGEKLYIATGPGKNTADTEIKDSLNAMGSKKIANSWSLDDEKNAGSFKVEDDKVTVVVGTFDQGHHDNLYIFNLDGSYQELVNRPN